MARLNSARSRWCLGTLAGAAVWAAPAEAHLVSTRFGEFYNGMLHPLITLAHLLPWLALALLAALQPARLGRWALFFFPMAVLIGCLLAPVFGLAPTALTTLAVFSFLVLGLAVASAWSVDRTTFIALILFFGLIHGLGNADLTLRGAAAWLFAGGVALAAYLVVALGTALGHRLAQHAGWGQVAVRAVGSWIAAIGGIYLTLLLTTS